MNRRIVPVLLAGLAGGLALLLTGCGAQADTSTSLGEPGSSDIGRASITARGTGKVSGTPDVVTVTLGVETRSQSASAALDENNTLAAGVITVLKTNGVPDADVQTSQLSIYPSYSDKGEINGYQVSNLVTTKLRDLTKAGAIIDTIGKTAGNAVRVQGLSFSIDDDTELRAAARTQAVEQAKRQAEQLADAAGVDLGPIYSIVETSSSSPMRYPMAMDGAAGAESVPLEAGSQDVLIQVDVVYEIAR